MKIVQIRDWTEQIQILSLVNQFYWINHTNLNARLHLLLLFRLFFQVLDFEIWGIKSTNTQNKSEPPPAPRKNIFQLPNVKL